MMNQILLIESKSEITNLFIAFFKGKNFLFRAVTDAVEALRLIDKDKSIELVFINCENAGMDGLEFLRICSVNHPDLLVVLFSDQMDTAKLGFALRYRAFDFLTLPVEHEQIGNVVKRAALTFNRQDRHWRAARFVHDVDFALTSKAADLSIEFIRDAVKKMLFRYTPINSNAVENILLALCEAIQNALDHGSLELDSTLKDQPGENDYESMFDVVKRQRLEQVEYGGRKIAVRMRIETEKLQISVADEGAGFKAEIRDEASGNVYGMGLMLIRNIVDRVYFNEKGNKITFEKNVELPDNFAEPAPL